MSPIQQMFLGVGPSGDRYWWQRCEQSDSSTVGFSGRSVTVDDDENSYFTCSKPASTYSRTFILGFDKDGVNIVKSYGGGWSSGETVASNKSFMVNYGIGGFLFANDIYIPGREGNMSSNYSVGVDVIDITSGQTPSQRQLQNFYRSGNNTDLWPKFLVGRLGSGLTYSVDFDGNNNLTQSGSSDFEFGTGDFTWEAWIKPSAWSTTSGNTIPIFSVAGTNGFWIGNHSNKFRILAYDGGVQLETTTFPIVRQWTHVAATRSGTSLKLFYNGVLIQTATNSHSFASSTVVNIALDATNYNNHFTGNISNLRVVKGTAVYTANFAPSVEPLTNITNTKLLCCNGNSATSSTVSPGTITATGSPTAAQDCPLSSSYLCGGYLRNTTLGYKNVPYLFKSGVRLYENNNDSTDLFYSKKEHPTGTYYQSTQYHDAAITSDGLYAYLVGIVQTNSSGTNDAYLLKINYLTGALISRNFYGGIMSGYGTDYFNAIAIDSSGNIYCAGKCKSGYVDKAYIIKLNSSLVIQWEKGMSNLNYFEKLVIDSSGDVYATGISSTSGYKAGYVMKITSSGTLDWTIKLTINGFTDRYPQMGNIAISGENDNLYFGFTYNKNPSSTSPTTTYKNQFAAIKYPKEGNITGTYGDLVFTSVTNLSLSNVTLPNNTNSLSYGEANRQNISLIERDAYSNGNPTIAKTNL